MEKHICDDKNGLGYTLYLDYYLPELELLEDEEAHYRKYGMIRKAYLKSIENRITRCCFCRENLMNI